MYPTWPDSLQQVPLVAGFSVSGEQPVKRQSMETGLDRVTRMSSSTVRTNNYSIICTNDQCADFWSFYENEANGGADMVRIPMVTANGVQFHTCRISTYPNQVPDGLEWRISFTLETDEQQIDWS